MGNMLDNIPNASTLINSMRSIGYNFESAVADIIDNSISADAKNVFISFPIESDKDVYLEFFDDGCGMTRDELIEAMRFGSVKGQERSRNDLGRFGLGLKTASISQCKKLTAISKKFGKVNGFCWDLDIISSNDNWKMIELSKDEISNKSIQLKKYDNLNNYTLIIWEKFDTLQRDVTVFNTIHNIFLDKIQNSEKHASLVFHRFLEEGLKIFFNGNPIFPFDPFLLKHNKTIIKPEQVINTKTSNGFDEKVKIQAFVLPYLKDLTKEDILKIGGEEQINNQGFYIYRNKRLMIHSTWFKIKPKAELSKNARIRVDIPNTLDDLWYIDIKKQNAIIPKALLEQLKGEVSDAIEKSVKLHKYKGHIQLIKGGIWNKVVDKRNNLVRYEINQDSIMINHLIENMSTKNVSQIKNLLRLISLSLPYKDIYNSVADNKEINTILEEQKHDLLLQAQFQFAKYKSKLNLSENDIIDLICNYEPFLSANIKSELKELLLWKKKA